MHSNKTAKPAAGILVGGNDKLKTKDLDCTFFQFLRHFFYRTKRNSIFSKKSEHYAVRATCATTIPIIGSDSTYAYSPFHKPEGPQRPSLFSGQAYSKNRKCESTMSTKNLKGSNSCPKPQLVLADYLTHIFVELFAQVVVWNRCFADSELKFGFSFHDYPVDRVVPKE
jgi:hypothetical protein